MNVEVKVAPKGSSVHLAPAKTVDSVVSVRPGEQIALNVASPDVASYTREGSDLLVGMKNGEVFRIANFYGGPSPSELFLTDGGKLVSTELTTASNGLLSASYVPQGASAEFSSLAASSAAAAGGGGGLSTAAIIGGVAAAGGGVAAAAGGGGSESPAGQPQTPPSLADTTAPTAATGLSVNGTGTQITGTAEAGATVLIDVNGDGTADVTGTVGSNGNFTVALSPPLTNGQTLSILVRDAAGNTSAPATVVAPDTTAPAPVTALAVSADGTIVTGRAEAGATVRLDTNGDGVPDATGVARADGTFSITLPQPLTDGQTVTATVRDAAGNTSGPATVTAPDTTPPPAATGVAISQDGTTITGTAQAGTLVRVDVNRDGVTDGSATAGADGRFTIALTPPLTNGETVTVTVRDGAGNTSLPTSAIAPDTTAPAPASGLVISADGATLSGTAEAGATVGIDVNGDGVIDRTVTAGANGSFTAPLSPPLLDGQTVTVTVRDAAGNVSGPATVIAPDTVQIPLPPTIDPSNGTVISGSAQVGYVVTLTDHSGVVIGSVVAGADGQWSFMPATPLIDGAIVNAAATNGQGVQGPSASIVVDAMAPAIPTIDPSNGLTLSGMAEAGSTITLTGPGGAVIGTTTVAADGRWTFTPSGALGDGIVVSATASDAAGNVSPVATTTTDAVSPSAPVVIPSNGSVLSGTAEAGSTVTIVNANGVPIATTVAGAGGAWSVSLSPPLADGVAVRVSASDAVGNVSPATIAVIDALAPVAPVLGATNGTIVSGTAEANAVVTITTPAGVVIGQVTAGADGRFSLSLPTPLANGAVVVARATDAAGNTGAAAAATVDSLPPLAPVIAPTNGLLVRGTAEAGSIVTVTGPGGIVIGTTTADANGTWSVTPALPLANGVVVSASAADAAGNVGAATTAIIDALAPVAPVFAPSNGVVLTGTAEAGSTVTISSGGVVIGQVVASAGGTWSFTPTTPLLNAATVSATSTDAAGNVSGPGSITIDTTLPATPVIAPTNGTLLSGIADAGVTVTVRDGSGALIGQVTADANGRWTVTPATPLADGTIVNAVATSSNGNASGAGSGVVDAVAPAVPVIAPGHGTEISGTAEAGATVTVTGPGGVPIGQTVAGTDGRWTVTPAAPLGDGTLVTATSTDAAGNVSGPATATIDALAPGVPTILPTAGAIIAGTAEAGAVITLTNGSGAVIGTVTAGTNGQWSFTPTVALANGVVVRATAIDAAGNVSPQANAIVDAVAPAAPLLAPTNGALLSGMAEANATITLRDVNGIVIGQTAADGTGNWSFAPATPLINGAVVQVVASDAAGNISTPSAVTVDALAPTVTIGASAGAIFSGTAEAGATVTLIGQGGAAIGQTVADGNGRWSITPATVIANGVQVSATATDTAGNASAPVATIVDSIAPAAPTMDPSNGSLLSGTAEVGATVTLTDGNGTVIGSATVSATGNWNFSPSAPLGNGAVVSATVADAAGNVGPAASVTIDAVPPLAPSIAPTNGATLSGTAEANAVVTLRDGNGNTIGSVTAGPNGAWSFSPSTPLPDGTTVTARAADAAGNVSPPATATVDAVAPAAPVVSPSNGTVVSGTGEAGATIILNKGDGSAIGTTTVGQSGNWSYTPTTPLPDGTVVNAVARDAAGNTSMPGSTTVDGIPPSLPILDLTSGISISGTGDVGATIRLTDALGNPLGTTTVGANGRWTVTFATPLVNGTIVVATAVDAVGNVTAPVNAVVDTVPPLPPILAPTNGQVITGVTEANAKVVLTDANGQTIGTVNANAQGAFSFSPSTALPNGTVVFAVATDGAGNSGTSATVTVDAIAPGLPTILPSNGLALSGTAEAGATVTVTNGSGGTIGTVTVAANGTWTITPSAPLPDATQIRVIATDAAGNVSATASAVVDALAPTAPSGLIVAANGTTITGVAEANAQVRVVVGNDVANPVIVTANAQGVFTATFPTAVVDGQTVSVTAVDAAGNVSAPGVAVAPDLGVPLVTIAEAADGYVNAVELANGIQVRVGLTPGSDPGDTVSVRFTGPGNYVTTTTHVVTAADKAAGYVNMTLTPPSGSFPEGAAQVSASIEGGLSSLPSVFVIDTVAPTTPVLSLLTSLLNISSEPGASLVVTVNAAGTSHNVTVTADSNGSASLDLLSGANLGLSLGDLLNASVSVRAADAAGNQSGIASLGLNGSLMGPLVSVNNFDVDATLLPPSIGFSGNTEVGSTVQINVVTPAATAAVTVPVDANGHFNLNLLNPSVLSQLNLSITDLLALGSGLSFNVVSTDAQGHQSAQYGLTLLGSGLSLDIGQVTINGTAGGDVLSGSTGHEVITAGGGSDLILNVGLSDQVNAGTGDDTIQITAANHTSINGGTGFDTLLFTNGIDIDYGSAGTGTWSNIERIDLGRGDSGSALTLTVSEVNAITDANHTLQITGDTSDQLNVAGAVDTLTDVTLAGHVYDVYTFGNTTLYIEQNTVHVSV